MARHSERCGIALGSNKGDRLANLCRAREELRSLHASGELFLCSKIYETEPVGCAPGTQSFLNALVEIGFHGDPHPLLAALREIETKLGRTASRELNAPRVIDLDIIFFGDLTVNEPALAIPHPRAQERRFVVAPLCDIHPGLVLPGQHETVAQLLEKLPPAPAAKPFVHQWQDDDGDTIQQSPVTIHT